MTASSNITTKELARHLGLLKRRSSTLLTSNDTTSINRKSKKEQTFAYLIILDFESTCWKDKANGHSNEIIEFPAVLLNLTNGEVVAKFQQYVKPTEQKVLSTFCTELTGITQDTVDGGVSIRACIKMFNDWVTGLKKEKGFTFIADNNSTEKKCAIVTWTDWDLNVCLKYECKRKHIPYASYLKTWIDLKKTYKDFYGRPPKGLRGAMEELCLHFIGREHSGINDATNTAYLAWKMVQDGCLMNITKSLVLPLKNSNAECVQAKENKVCNLKTQNIGTSKPSMGQGASLYTPKSTTTTTTSNHAPTVKITPPLCECGRRCKRKKVMNPGPNTERIFYACPVDRASGCKFFRWEEKVNKMAEVPSCTSKNPTKPSNFGQVKKASDIDEIKFHSVKRRKELVGACTNLFKT